MTNTNTMSSTEHTIKDLLANLQQMYKQYEQQAKLLISKQTNHLDDKQIDLETILPTKYPRPNLLPSSDIFQDQLSIKNMESELANELIELKIPEETAWVILGFIVCLFLYFVYKIYQFLTKKYKKWKENRINKQFIKNVTNTEFLAAPTDLNLRIS